MSNAIQSMVVNASSSFFGTFFITRNIRARNTGCMLEEMIILVLLISLSYVRQFGYNSKIRGK